MIISKVVLRNWKNFQNVDVALKDRVFLVGPNASGKSNFLDAFRFLRDVAKEGGSLQEAIRSRGGVPKIRCLYARRVSDIEIEVHLSESIESENKWIYSLGITQEKGGKRKPIISREFATLNGRNLFSRPNDDDRNDPKRLTQTHLEQINANVDFREVADFLGAIQYMHLVPQLLRYPEAFPGPEMPGDPFGRRFLEKVAKEPKNIRQKRLEKIEKSLQSIVPHLKHLTFEQDETGNPHLAVISEHWRPKAGKQREDQFSDGTLRLIGLFWSLLEGYSLLLLEEPELSLNSSVISGLAPLIYKLQRQRGRQVILSTHSADLLSDKGIDGDDVLILKPEKEGTKVFPASSKREIKDLLDGGLSIADAVLPHAAPQRSLIYWGALS
jgi:predicted ATPase